MNQKKERINDPDLFIYSIIGEEKWDQISAIKKLHILQKFTEIQKLVNNEHFS